MAESTFTFRVDEDLKAAFAAAAKASDRTSAQVLREAMRDYITEEPSQTPEYLEWLHKKVDASLADYLENGGIPNEKIEAEFATRRAELRARIAREAIRDKAA